MGADNTLPRESRIDFAGLPSYSELLRVRGAQEPRASLSCSQKLRALRASWSCKLGKGCPKQRVDSHRNYSSCSQSLPSPELQALLSPYNSTACGQQSPLLRASEVNSEWRVQIAPASAVCGELGLPSQERVPGFRGLLRKRSGGPQKDHWGDFGPATAAWRRGARGR